MALAVAAFAAFAEAQGKRNSRPADNAVQDKKNDRPAAEKPAQQKPFEPTYFYEFSQPSFIVSKIRIVHDDAGRGTITFSKRDYGEPITDPIEVSPLTLERIHAALEALDFVNSTEDYQYEKDYSHLGNISLRVKQNGRERTAKYNWTENKYAKELADIYRGLSLQYIWVFDINLSRENQPLMAPGLMDSLDAMIRRNEIPDPAQMVPLLTKLSNDERIPLMARNHAAKLVSKIEKKK